MSETKSKKRVGILRGGTGRQYHYSLQKGGDIISCVCDHLADKYKTCDILIDKNHIWHLNGAPINPGDLINKIDIAWNTTHPSFSNILESLNIPHISTPAFPAGLQNSKELLREHMKRIDLPMPRSLVLPLYQKDFDGPREKYAIKKAKEIFEKFGAPWVVKSFTEDSNMAIHLAKTFPELVRAIEDGVSREKSILVEEFVTGKIASTHSIPEFRGEEIYIFPLVNTFGIFSSEEKENLYTLARRMHEHLGAKHYLKSDFVLNPRGRIYLLQIETTPDLKSGSQFEEVCESAGAKMHQVVEHMLEQATS